MNHPVETKTWALVKRLLVKVDPQHEGWCIDAGVGVDDWWFDLFEASGYHTIAIDPKPTEAALDALFTNATDFCQCLIGCTDYDCQLRVSDDPNLHCAVPGRIEAVGFIPVRAYPLSYFVERRDITHLTCLKLDIEGMEPEVIQSLPDCKILPDILVFEFGGFVRRKDVSGPWSVENVAQVNAAMQTLDRLGYGTMWAITDVDEHPFVIGANGWFDFISPECGYGNIVAVREEAFHG